MDGNFEYFTGSHAITGSLIVTGGITGSLQGVISSSYAATASFVQNAQTASYVQTAQTASYVLNAVSASRAITSSYAVVAQTLLGSVVSASYAATASQAHTASYIAGGNVDGAVALASNAFTAGEIYVSETNVNGDYKVIFTDNLTLEDNSNVYKDADSTLLYNPGLNKLTVGTVLASAGFTGSLLGTAATASFVQTAQTASYVLQAISASFASTASFVQNAQTASFVQTAQTSSYVLNAVSASYATTASYVQNAQTASFVQTAQTASYVQTAQTASYVQTAQTASYVLQAVSASYASTASYIQNSQTASYVQNAQTASYVNPLIQDVQITGSLDQTGSLTLGYKSSNYSNISISRLGNNYHDVILASGIEGQSANTMINLRQNPTSEQSFISFTSPGYIDIYGEKYINFRSNQAGGASVRITGSLDVNGSITGSLLGTATTASYVQTAQTASYVLNAVSASFASTASYIAVNYTIYKVLLTFSGGTFTVTQLENTIGDGSNTSPADIQWSNPSNGQLRATKTNAFTSSNIFIRPGNFGSGTDAYFINGQKFNSNQLIFNITKYDGTQSSTPSFTSLPIEIQIYN
jgi:hypothetical protein